MDEYRPYHYIIVVIALILMALAFGIVVDTFWSNNWIWVK